VTNVARFEGDDLLAAIYLGDATKAARAVASLEAEAEPIQLLLWQLANDTREALAIASNGRASRPYPSPRMRELEAIARRHGSERLKRLLMQAHEVDRLVKGVGDSKSGPDMWRAFLELALRLAGKASVPTVS
jgi:DNA polymerase III delta subunit